MRQYPNWLQSLTLVGERACHWESIPVPGKTCLGERVGAALELSSVSAVSHKFTIEYITSVIGVIGELVYNILYGFPQTTAKGIIVIMAGTYFELDSELTL